MEENTTTTPAPDTPLPVHDKAEGRSAEGRAVFAKICKRLTTKQIGAMSAHRVLKGEAGSEPRRVTRDIMVKAMDAAGIGEEESAALWEEYFGGPPATIAEFIRRRMIISGSIRDYGEAMDLSHPTLSRIMHTRAVTAETMWKLMTKGEVFPWKADELMGKWRRENEAFRMKKFGMNLLGARIETLFEMRPTASRSEWVERGNMPESLKDMSKNRIRILLSALRHGEAVPWESVDRVLVGIDCTLIERVEVADAWLMAKAHPPPPRKKRETKKGETIDEGGEDNADEPAPPEPIPQSTVPYPEHLANKPDLVIIGTLVTELGGGEVPAESDEHALQERLRQTLVEHGSVVSDEPSAPDVQEEEHADPVATTPEPAQEAPLVTDVPEHTDDTPDPGLGTPEEAVGKETEEVFESLESMLFPEPQRYAVEDEPSSQKPDFSRVNSVWNLAEYLHNFSGRGYAGYDASDEEHAIIAAEVNVRSPLGINDAVSTLKMLAYCYGRDPESRSTAFLMDALAQSLGGPEHRDVTEKLMRLLTDEPRFRMFLLYYRDQHPDSPVTTLLSSLTDLTSLEPPEPFDPHASTDRDRDYHGRIYPKPRPPKKPLPKMKRTAEEEIRSELEAEEDDRHW